MVASENPEVIEGRRWFIVTDILDSEQVAEDGSVDNDGAASDKEDESGSLEAGVRSGVTQSGTEQLEKLHQFVKYSSLQYYILKPPSLLAQGFKSLK